jgi:hypothetical protein
MIKSFGSPFRFDSKDHTTCATSCSATARVTGSVMADHKFEVSSMTRASDIHDGRVIELAFKTTTGTLTLTFAAEKFEQMLLRMADATEAAQNNRFARPHHS